MLEFLWAPRQRKYNLFWWRTLRTLPIVGKLAQHLHKSIIFELWNAINAILIEILKNNPLIYIFTNLIWIHLSYFEHFEDFVDKNRQILYSIYLLFSLFPISLKWSLPTLLSYFLLPVLSSAYQILFLFLIFKGYIFTDE